MKPCAALVPEASSYCIYLLFRLEYSSPVSGPERPWQASQAADEPSPTAGASAISARRAVIASS